MIGTRTRSRTLVTSSPRAQLQSQAATAIWHRMHHRTALFHRESKTIEHGQIPVPRRMEDQHPFLRVQVHEHSGRSYHAACAIPAGTTVLDADTPYAYTIWKPFRNEVCAECWRYDGGRRTFLTRRDDEGVSEQLTDQPGLPVRTEFRSKSRVGAGLWFCDATCQEGWLQREGQETIQLLRSLEEARRQKEVERTKDDGFRLEDLGCTELTRENIDRAWWMIAQKEWSPKEVRKWKNLQLTHFETDIARYVLIALSHRYRERSAKGFGESREDDLAGAPHVATGTSSTLRFGGDRWEDFAALQSNELRHLKTYPDSLENQIRVCQALLGRFTNSARPCPPELSRHPDSEGRPEGVHEHHENHKHRANQNRTGQEEDVTGSRAYADFGSTITIENIRRAFSVDPGNSFGVWETPLTDESELVGFAVYPTPSFFNHRESPLPGVSGHGLTMCATDCAPNVTKMRRGRRLGFVTTRQVELGEELCISYGHAEKMSLAERQRELMEGWYFECRCGRCVSEAEASGAAKLG